MATAFFGSYWFWLAPCAASAWLAWWLLGSQGRTTARLSPQSPPSPPPPADPSSPTPSDSSSEPGKSGAPAILPIASGGAKNSNGSTKCPAERRWLLAAWGGLVGLLGAVACLAVSVAILASSLRTAARMERDWQAEAAQQEKVNLARRFEARQLTENLLRLREFSRVLDAMGAE